MILAGIADAINDMDSVIAGGHDRQSVAVRRRCHLCDCTAQGAVDLSAGDGRRLSTSRNRSERSRQWEDCAFRTTSSPTSLQNTRNGPFKDW